MAEKTTDPVRKPVIAGNWKMYKDNKEAVEFVKQLADSVKNIADSSKYVEDDLGGGSDRSYRPAPDTQFHPIVQNYVDIVICPPFTAISDVREGLGDNIRYIKLGAQNMHWEKEGAYTGEVSAQMLKKIGVEYVIIGHSERRQYFGETNEIVNKKIKAALDSGLIPIICVGETLKEHYRAQNVVQEQLSEGLDGITENQALKMIIAYEPVWAIGTGKTATPEEAGDMHAFIREVIIGRYSPKTSEKMRILYGGSVKPDNISALMKDPEIDGALIGGASLKHDSFVEIIKETYNLYKDKEFIQK